MPRVLNSLVCLASCFAIGAGPVLASESDDSWFDDDWQEKAEAVNEGPLEILQAKPDKSVHYHLNQIRISEKSIHTGWVDVNQCHEHLDAVSALQIVFNKDRVRNIQIVSHRNIEKTWVEGSTVQLENIEHDSRLCLRAETKALSKKGSQFILKNGPFMRRFLDGYYPMHVRMEVEYAKSELVFVKSMPIAADVGDIKSSISMDVWFSGQLRTEFIFRPANK